MEFTQYAPIPYADPSIHPTGSRVGTGTTDLAPGDKVVWLQSKKYEHVEWLTAVAAVSLKKGRPLLMTEWSDGDPDSFETAHTLTQFVREDEFSAILDAIENGAAYNEAFGREVF